MRNNISLLSTAILSIFATNAHAKIYTDQIVLDNLGEDICRSGYRPLERHEALEHKNAIIGIMGKWQITGLKDDWVIMGPGYEGEIKSQKSEHTFCHPIKQQSEIPDYPTIVVSEGTNSEGEEVAVQYELVHDRQNFVRPLSYLAYYLGYAWVGGDNGKYVGEDMGIKSVGDTWEIQGNSTDSCSGYRCDEKTKITVSNFAYTVNDKKFWHGEVKESERELVDTVYATARNKSDKPQQIVVDLGIVESTNWSKTDNFGFAQQVKTENEFIWPLVGKTKLSITLDANQSFSDSQGETTSKNVTLQARPMVPAESEMPVKIELYRSSISYPYKFDADISYDVNFNGFLRWSGNAWYDQPKDRPYKSHTFTFGRGSEDSADIRYQWNHRYIPGKVQWWDWSWAIRENGLDNMQNAVGGSLRPFSSYVSGQFHAEAQYAGTIEIGEAGPIGIIDDLQLEPKDVTTHRVGDIEVTTNFNADKLSALGFKDAKMNIYLAD
ncbi:aerolysin family beta-barrel pore-forming toxin [Vibrio sp. AND4]|uniref:aerolysin family beta-barrel pore-forming toxin n=1 Tax=Vibrio sp. AND4 TaxID=314289 RepID=UPI00015EFA58|nr:aerolysin family beta-barrel pore-forming toxin [Vibrio sp. AND4]EDP59921.1 hemolysin [Vibrio sp. AND4]